MVAIVWGHCMEGLWRGCHFAMKKLQDIYYLDEGYALSSNGNVCVLLTFMFGWFCYSRCYAAQFNI